MRTREEQIEAACQQIEQARGFSNVHRWFLEHILEAERRAEERVRAEIGRDSERLDWLAKQIIRVPADAPPTILNGKELRDGIDAAREEE